ncbi:MAG: DUF3592 domain-containing protein [Bacteroidales bacterium]|nr:DUF3592 domain-containing protein [Bacteroidales bacterium]
MCIVIKGRKIPLIPLVKHLLCVILGLFFLRVSIPLAEGLIRINWPTTTGTVLNSELEEGPLYRSMYVRLLYEYSVGDKKFEGSYIHNPKDRLFTKEKAEESIKTKYAPYNQVEVYYNPHHPEIGFLEPGPKLEEIFVFFLGLILFAGGSYLAYWTIKDTIDGVDYTYREFVTIRERIMSAISAESENPREALKLYRQAKKQNEEFSVLIFVISFAAPILATVLALCSSLISERFSEVLYYVILACVGFGVPAMLRAFRDRHNGIVSIFAPKEPRWFWINVVIAGPFLLFRNLLLILTGILFAFLAMGPLLAILLLCGDLQCGITENPYIMTVVDVLAAGSGLVIILKLLADVRSDDLLPPVIGIKILFAALRRNRNEVFEHFSILLLGYVFVALKSGNSAIILAPSFEAVILSVLSGLFLALSLARGDLSTETMVFIHLGMSRCHIRLQNWASALVQLKPVDKTSICEFVERDDCRKLCGYLSHHLMSVIEGVRLGYQPGDLEDCIDRAKETGVPDIPDSRIWIKNIRENQLLVEGEEVRAALGRTTKHRCLLERIDFDYLLGFFGWYWGAGIICFIWWLFRVL